jgi:hypothetical protein
VGIEWRIVMRSTPAAPRFSRTCCHARSSTSLRWMRSQSAWNRRDGDRLAARYSLTWSSRTLSCLVWLGLSAMHRSFRHRRAQMKQSPFPHPRLCCPRATSGTTGSPPPCRPDATSRLITAYTRPSLPERTTADPGPTRASPLPAPTFPTMPIPLPRGVLDRCASRIFAASMAFALNSRARLPLAPANGASVTRRQDSHHVTAWPVAPPNGAFDTGLRRRAFPPDAASLLPGALALTGTGLPPARPMRAYVRIRLLFPGITSLRTVGTRTNH